MGTEELYPTGPNALEITIVSLIFISDNEGLNVEPQNIVLQSKKPL